MELEFLRLEFHHFLLDQTVRLRVLLFLLLLLLLLPLFFLICFCTSSFQITSSVFQIILLFWICFSRLFLCFSRSPFCFSRFFLRFWLSIWFFGSSSSSPTDSSIELKFEKLEFHVDKLLQLSTRTQVFETQVCHQTRASQTRDASF